jgi:hypothetical protein
VSNSTVRIVALAALLSTGCSTNNTRGDRGDGQTPGDHDSTLHADSSPPADSVTPADPGGGDASGCDGRQGTPFVPCPDTGFVPDSPTQSWNHATTSLIVLEGDPNHRGIDTIVNAGQDQLLIAKFAYGVLDDDLKDENVEVWVQEACGVWSKLGTVATSNDGQYGTVNGVVDDGGRVFFTIPVGQRLGLGSYRVKMLVKGDHSEANFWLFVWPAGTHAVVSDIDGTITTQENDGAWSVLDPASPDARPLALETFAAYAAKGYRLIYLTARPDFLTNGTTAWFAAHGFPVGTFHLSTSDFGELGVAATTYKAGYLASIITGANVEIDWIYGNKDTDLNAYLAAGITPSRINILPGTFTGDPLGANLLTGYDGEPSRIGCLPPVNLP